MKAVEWTPTCSKLRAQKRGNYERSSHMNQCKITTYGWSLDSVGKTEQKRMPE